MGKLALSVAIGDYDRTRPLIDGRVQIDAVDLHPPVDQRPGPVVVADGDGERQLAHGHPASRKAASIMASTTHPAISSTSRSAEPQMSFSTT